METMRQLYETSYVISIVNNEQQPRILNKRQNIKQGDRASTILYNYSADALLVHLHKRLQGVVYHKLTKAGPFTPSLAGQLLWRPGSVSWASWMMSNVHSPHSKNLRCWMQGSGSLKGPQDLSTTGTQQRRNVSC